MSAENALLTAIHARLSGDAELTALVGPDAIFDRLLSRPRLPAIVFGECETRDNSTATESGAEHFLSLEVWSEAHGRKAVQTIEARVKSLLDDADLAVSGFVLVNLRHRSSRIRRVTRTGYFLAEMRFRAVTEPA
ncbi:tail completion protein gp17 [Martelella radicis]|uniref:tail completion protein gp17 n=1 Tax=Martelella radicis TaxID=1397476 RepID=UPI001622BDF2